MKTKAVTAQTLDELAESVYKELVAVGVTEEVAKAFVCFRFHPHCPWGLGRIKVNDMQTFAIVRPTDESMQNVEAVFVATEKTMTCFSDLQGLEVIPPKSQLN